MFDDRRGIARHTKDKREREGWGNGGTDIV